MLKLNLGCGDRHMVGFLNVDKEDFYKPEFKWNLENFPWPWETDSVSEVRMIQVLEHLGQDVSVYFGIIKELYRVCKNGALIHIEVPHWNNDNFHHDPTHVRKITPVGLAMFSQHRNLMNAGAETKLGLIHEVDFEVTGIAEELNSDLQTEVDCGRISKELKDHITRTQLNSVMNVAIELRVIKPSTSIQRKNNWWEHSSVIG